MNELVLIDQKEILGRNFRIYGSNENPMFMAKDIMEWLDMDSSQVKKFIDRVDDDEKGRNNVTTLGGTQGSWFLTEDGLYEVLMQSRKPIAKAFKKEVKKILKDIRRHGMYAREELLDNPDLLIQVAQELKKEKDQRKALEMKIEEDKPKVLFADAVSISSTSILVGEMAKLIKQNGIDIGQNRLFKWMRENGYLISRRGNDYNLPTQRSMNLKLFEIKETPVVHNNGPVTINKTSKVTGKGQQYFINKFLNEKIMYGN